MRRRRGSRRNTGCLAVYAHSPSLHMVRLDSSRREKISDHVAMEISSPRELIAAIPHLLGFAPDDSLVITALAENRVASMVRIDWPAAELVLTGSLSRYAKTIEDKDIVLAFYCDGVLEDFSAINTIFISNDVLDVLQITQNRWRSHLCTDVECCPANGRDVIAETAVVDAEFIYQGSSPFASRDDLVDLLSPQTLDTSERAECAQAFSALTADLDVPTEIEWFLQACDAAEKASYAVLARGARACNEIRIRDGLLRSAFDSLEVRMKIRSWLMTNLCQIPESHVASAATVLAGVVWLDGNGPLARIALDRALDADPEYSLAQLLDTALVNAVPSRIWSESLEAVTYEECIRGAA